MKFRNLLIGSTMMMMSGMTGNLWAGGLLTNTNQNIAFNRMMSREASIGIDGVYSNPAGVAFMDEGMHLSVNWQMPWQTRTIQSNYALYANNMKDPSLNHKHEGKAFVPCAPSLQAAYNYKRWSFQFNFAIGGGGGKCEFDNGLGSFERTIANTAYGMSTLLKGLSGASQMAGLGELPAAQMFPNARYSYDGYMKGKQYYFNASLGAAFKITDNLSVFAGVRAVIAQCAYEGYLRNITVGGNRLSMMVNPEDAASADIEIDCEQKGLGWTPIVGLDFKLKRWNFSARYEFRTRLELENKSSNKTPDLNGVKKNLLGAIPQPLLGNEQVASTLNGFCQTFEETMGNTLNEYADGETNRADVPSLLTVGVGCDITEKLHINVGFHWFDDKNAVQVGNKQKLLDRGTLEFNAGIEFAPVKLVTISAGWQMTRYGLTDAYMQDKAFSTNSNSIGAGLEFHVSDVVSINVAYFKTLYSEYSSTKKDSSTNLPVSETFSRKNDVVGAGVNLSF